MAKQLQSAGMTRVPHGMVGYAVRVSGGKDMLYMSTLEAEAYTFVADLMGVCSTEVEVVRIPLPPCDFASYWMDASEKGDAA